MPATKLELGQLTVTPSLRKATPRRALIWKGRRLSPDRAPLPVPSDEPKLIEMWG